MKRTAGLVSLITLSVVSLALVARGQDAPPAGDPKGMSPAEMAGWNSQMQRILKTTGRMSEIRTLIMQGNQIKTLVLNTSSISRPGLDPNVLNLVWHGLSYGYEFGPLVAAKVKDRKAGSTDSSEFKIVTEGFWSSSDGEYGPDGTKWGWLPKEGYAAPNQPDIASWSARAKVNNDLRLRPPSWPESWYNAALGRYVWPAYLGSDATTPDEEVYFVVDDSTKREFAYYPFAPGDSLRRGLGVNLECRFFQFQNPLAQDIIFLVYTVENASPRILPNVYFGMFGDPNIGGSNDYSDDRARFIPALAGTVFDVNGQDLAYVNGVLTSQRSRNLVYAWDADGKGDIPGIVPGYFGYKFLESPTNSNDGIDNDDDGIIDETPFDGINNPGNVRAGAGQFIDGISTPVTTGIADVVKYTAVYGPPKPRWSGDENGNWDPTKDDVGIDGIAGTHDAGEGDGVPSQLYGADGTWLGSEPDFGFRDVNESDQIGLRSFWALTFGGTGDRPKDDASMYDKLSSDTSDVTLLYPPSTADNIFLYGSGPFTLHTGSRQRFSIALLMGQTLDALLLNSETAQRVLEANYRFAQPPPKPNVAVVPGDGRVTLYWDNASEEGRDPLTGVNDFMGYKIYRSEDYSFSDVFTITDANGTPFLGKALYDTKAQRYAQWHLPWNSAQQAEYAGGYHPVEFQGHYVKYYMGEPTDTSGLRHQFIDSTVTNGKMYFYAVVAFDSGANTANLQIPPTETQTTITRDPVTQQYKYDVNTVGVTPGPPASGAVNPTSDIEGGKTTTHSGNGTGTVYFDVLDPYALGDNAYRMTFAKTLVGTDSLMSYTILRETPIVEQLAGKDTLFISLAHKNVDLSSVVIKDAGGRVVPSTSILVDSAGGQLRATVPGVLLATKTYTINYRYYPVAASTLTKFEDANPAFDGLRPFVTDDPLAINQAASGFNVNTTSFVITLDNGQVGSVPIKLVPLDVQVQFHQMTYVASGSDSGRYTYVPWDTLKPTLGTTKVISPFHISCSTDTTTLSVLVVDNGAKGRWDPGDRLIFLTPRPYATTNATMLGITFSAPPDPSKHVNVSGGEIYTARMKKPFQSRDVIDVTTRKMEYDSRLGDDQLGGVIVVPNPYVEFSETEGPGYRSGIRGDRAIEFRRLPHICTIRIYTLVGELVRTLYKNDSSDFLTWDVLSSESARLAYGVYIYQIETPTGATKIGRLALIK